MRGDPLPDAQGKAWTFDKKLAMQAVSHTAALEAAESLLQQQGPDGPRQDGVRGQMA